MPDSYLISNAEAVPKKILDLMNVEGLTRENVASHLQVQIFPISSSLSRKKKKNKYGYAFTERYSLIRKLLDP